MIITDTEGKICYVNPAFESTTGYGWEEVMGRSPRILESGRDDVLFFNELWKVLTSGKIWNGRLTNKRKDGGRYTVEGTVSPVHDGSGATVNYVAVMHDMTKELSLEAQYHQAQKMEAVGRLAAGVAHDLNNLLSPILGYGEMLLDELDPENDWYETIKEIHKAGLRGKSVVRQLLAFSRKQTLEIKVIQLNDVIANFAKLLRRMIREDIEIDTLPATDLPSVLGDEGQIEQVIMNLVVNAQDAMPGGGRLTIETSVVDVDETTLVKDLQDDQPRHCVMLTVRDTGHGMDGEVLEKIFEPFFTTKAKDKGTGLGLAAVYSIVKHHGGSIRVQSEPGQGSIFQVYLPKARSAAPQSEETSSMSKDVRGKETILVADDDDMIRNLVVRILQGQGYSTFAASSCSEAMELLADHKGPLDLLVADVIMPAGSGRELFDRVAQRYSDIKVLFMSGYTDDQLGFHGVLEEGTPFIRKPFSVKGLAAKVREVIEGANPL